MNRLTTLTVLFLIIFNSIFGQDNEKYADLVNEASRLYKNKEYVKSGQKYSEAFEALGGKGVVKDRYDAACVWALANLPDSSFIQLFKIAQNGNYTNLSHITIDSDLTTLHQDERWSNVIDIVRNNKEKAEANLNKPLVAILDTVYQEDQKYRYQIKAIEEKYGWESDEMKAHWGIINEKDSINLIRVQKILDEYGWLGPDVVGGQGNVTLFLVIQHSDLEIQEKYLPMMREATKKGDARPSSLALLEDRVALGKNEKQIYGSQVARNKETGEYYVLPLMDPENVNERRAEVGLGSIQDYILNWGIIWNVEEYKLRLPEYEAMQKK